MHTARRQSITPVVKVARTTDWPVSALPPTNERQTGKRVQCGVRPDDSGPTHLLPTRESLQSTTVPDSVANLFGGHFIAVHG